MKLPAYAAGQQTQPRVANLQPGKLSDAQRQDLQVQQIRASYRFSASVADGDNYYKLLVQTSTESVSSSLRIDTPPVSAEPPPVDGGDLDLSPEATAKRILDFSTGFLELFKQQHPGEDQDAVLGHFMDTIGGGIAKGFAEARKILDGMGLLQGDTASNIDKTWELVQSGLKTFASQAGQTTTTAA